MKQIAKLKILPFSTTNRIHSNLRHKNELLTNLNGWPGVAFR